MSDRTQSGSNTFLAVAVLGLAAAILIVALVVFTGGFNGLREAPQPSISIRAPSAPNLPRMPDPTPMPTPTPRPS